MVYFKTKEQIEAEAMGGLIGLGIRLIAWVLVYSPFVLVFVVASFYINKLYGYHLLVSVIVGLIAAVVFYLIIAFLYGAQLGCKDKNKIAWISLLLLNMTLISGLPFFIGMSISLDLINDGSAVLMEKIIAGGFGGFLLAAPAYFGVTRSIVAAEK